MAEEAFVKIEINNHIGEITFFHPAHNSLPSHILSELAETITAAGNNEAVNVIILKSGGDRTFCAGASFTELVAIDNFEDGKKFFMGFANVINACRKCPKIIIGRVQGKAVGGGVGLAAATDYCMATKFAAIKLSELAVGIGPFVVGPAVQKKLGVSNFQKMAINATAFQTAQWAFEQGLYADIFESTEALDEAVHNLAEQLSNSSPEAQQQIKQIIWEGEDHWDTLLESRAEMSGRLVLSSYTKEVLAKYNNAK